MSESDMHGFSSCFLEFSRALLTPGTGEKGDLHYIFFIEDVDVKKQRTCYGFNGTNDVCFQRLGGFPILIDPFVAISVMAVVTAVSDAIG